MYQGDPLATLEWLFEGVTSQPIPLDELMAIGMAERCRQCQHSTLLHGATRLTEYEFATTCNMPGCKCID